MKPTYYMPDMFEQAIQDKTQEYNKAKKDLDKKISEIENSENANDSGLGDIEDRAELNKLNDDMRKLEAKYHQEIESLKVPTK